MNADIFNEQLPGSLNNRLCKLNKSPILHPCRWHQTVQPADMKYIELIHVLLFVRLKLVSPDKIKEIYDGVNTNEKLIYENLPAMVKFMDRMKHLDNDAAKNLHEKRDAEAKGLFFFSYIISIIFY